MEKLLNLQKKVDDLEAWRYMRIGSVVDVTAPDLPLENCMWADGSLALFDLWPELKAKYEKGGFSGLLLPYNCSDEDKKNYPLKWVPNSNNPTGLFVPRLTGLFARYCSGKEAGKYNVPGMPDISGSFQAWGHRDMPAPFGAFYQANPVDDYSTTEFNTGSANGWRWFDFMASRLSGIYGTSATVMPASVKTPIALYLGSPAEV